MEVARIVSSPVLRFADSGVNNFSSNLPHRAVNSRVSARFRDYSVILKHEFSDSGHVQYYVSPTRSGGKKLKEKSKEMKTVKKMKQKLIERLSKDLEYFARTSHSGEIGSSLNLMDEVKEKTISEATEILLAELRQFKLEKKEQKRKRKEEKASLIKATDMVDPASSSSSSSSSSSESSDSDCGVVKDMSRFRNTNVKQFTELANYKNEAICTPAKDTETNVEIIGGDCRPNCSNNSATVLETQRISIGEEFLASCSNKVENEGIAESRKIEICMGGKCKKMGAVALMEEFEKKVGGEATVVGCKCMGKCKNAPNVKLSNYPTMEPLTNPLSICLGVGLEDVDAIVADLLGKDRNGLMAIS